MGCGSCGGTVPEQIDAGPAQWAQRVPSKPQSFSGEAPPPPHRVAPSPPAKSRTTTRKARS